MSSSVITAVVVVVGSDPIFFSSYVKNEFISLLHDHKDQPGTVDAEFVSPSTGVGVVLLLVWVVAVVDADALLFFVLGAVPTTVGNAEVVLVFGSIEEVLLFGV